MKIIYILVPGEPIAQPRARATAFGKHARMYTPTTNGIHAYKAAIKIIASKEHQGEPMSGPVCVDCSFVFSRPKSHFRTGKRAGELRDDAPYFHTSRRDRDNLDKACLDAMTGVIYVDDAQVCQGEIVKRYTLIGESPKTTIRISQLENKAPYA